MQSNINNNFEKIDVIENIVPFVDKLQTVFNFKL